MNNLRDDEARALALDATRSFIVQAPAGSGKTELLIQRYLRLLATVERPEQILAITFTRKAASEMRNRILQSLANCRDAPRPTQAHAAHTWDLAQAALQADRERRWQLESHPARLRIQTIDAFNASLARNLPVLAQMGAGMEIATDQWPVYEAVGVRLLEQLGHEDAQLGAVLQLDAALITVLRHLANRVPDFISMLSELLAHRDHWLPILIRHRNDSELRHSIEATLQAAIEHHLQRVHDALPTELHAEIAELVAYGATNRLSSGVKENELAWLKACSELQALPSASAAALDAWRGLATVLCKKDGEFYNSLTKTQGFPTENKQIKQRMLALLNTLREINELESMIFGVHALPTAQFSDSQWQVLQALLHLLPRAVSELMLEFQARGEVDYVELSLRALRALGEEDHPTDLAIALDERLQHILVDEFQDTSITQMRLLQALTANWSAGPGDNNGRTLFCVGDPMQSIYRFRQAEVGLFLELQAHGLPGMSIEALHLKTNFRSTLPIVQWINQCFTRVMPAHDDAESGAVHYSASQARPDAHTEGGVYMHAAIDLTSQGEAKRIAALVQDKLATPSQRIAILVSGRSHVGDIAAELKQAGVAFKAVDIERLQDRPLVQDLIALTRALVHLGDRTAWLACLRAPWTGLELQDLHALAASDAEQTIHALLEGFDLDSLRTASRQRLQRFKTVMNAALAQRGRHALRDWVERTWLALSGPACLRNASELDDADAYFARLDELHVAGDLDDVTRLESQLSKLYATSASNDARVEIMTVHKSKGLEFDVVILPSLHRIGGRDSTRLLRWTRLTGLPADGLVLAPPGAKGFESDAIYQWLVTLEAQRARHEMQRLLYVAATRARRELHLFGSARLNKAGDAPSMPTRGTLLELLWPQMRDQFEQAIKERSVDTNSIARNRPLLRRLPAEWRAPPADAALIGDHTDITLNAQDNPEFDWVGETSRHIGTVVHAELERLAKLPIDALAHWQGAAQHSHFILQLAEHGVPEALRASAVARVIRAIEQTLQDPKGRWILGLNQAHREVASELALTGVIDGKLVNGVIDRSFVDAQGIRWIVDFKTSAHEGGGRAEFLQSEVERYRTQMQRYTRLLNAWKPGHEVKAALYFPLLGEWREL